jgi:nicotinic acid phosphoribosyltransferase
MRKNMKPDEIKHASGALMTDQYQLTMAQLYFRMGLHETKAQFDHFYRSNPDYGIHKAGYCINAGLDSILDWLDQVVFGEEEIQYLRTQTSATGGQLFGDDFLDWLVMISMPKPSTCMPCPRAESSTPMYPYMWSKAPWPSGRSSKPACSIPPIIKP